MCSLNTVLGYCFKFQQEIGFSGLSNFIWRFTNQNTIFMGQRVLINHSLVEFEVGMDKSSVISKAKILVSKGDLQGAIKEMVSSSKGSRVQKKQLAVLTARLMRIKQDNIKGIASYDSYNSEKNRILNSFLDLLENFEEEKEGIQKKSDLKTITLFLIGIMTLVTIIVLIPRTFAGSELPINTEGDTLHHDLPEFADIKTQDLDTPLALIDTDVVVKPITSIEKNQSPQTFTLAPEFQFLSEAIETELHLSFNNKHGDIPIEFSYTGEIEQINSNSLYRYPGGNLQLMVDGQKCQLLSLLPIERTHMAGNSLNFVTQEIKDQIITIIKKNQLVILDSISGCLKLN